MKFGSISSSIGPNSPLLYRPHSRARLESMVLDRQNRSRGSVRISIYLSELSRVGSLRRPTFQTPN
jgi:hypothetical protein